VAAGLSRPDARVVSPRLFVSAGKVLVGLLFLALALCKREPVNKV